MDSDGMLDWSASDCEDYEDRIMAAFARACPDSWNKLSDTWEWRGPCCLFRVHRQMRRCLFTPTWKESIWQGLTVQPQRLTHVKPQDQSFLVPVNDMNPMAIADSGASHVIPPQTALFDSKAAKPVNLRLAAGDS